MRWVKASEGLPCRNESVFLNGCMLDKGYLRLEDEPGNNKMIVLYDDYPFGDSYVSCWEIGHAELNKVEWLDEKNPSAPATSEAIKLLKEYEQWEADLISSDKMWWPLAKDDVLTGDVYEKMLVLQEKRNKILRSSPKEPESTPSAGWIETFKQWITGQMLELECQKEIHGKTERIQARLSAYKESEKRFNQLCPLTKEPEL